MILRATPTHPYDDTAPTFAGTDLVSDLGTGDRVRVSWSAATDPDTPGSGVDPSTPIKYSVYISDSASTLGTGDPSATTTETSVEIGGLRPGVPYYVLVRASDTGGNTTRIRGSFPFKWPRRGGPFDGSARFSPLPSSRSSGS